MNAQALIPLIAFIAYIPLVVILLTNRPWQSQQKFFFLFLIPAILWSVSDILFRSDFLVQYKLTFIKTGLCFAIWMGIQFHYFLRSFHHLQDSKIPFAYALLLGTVILAALDEIPGSINIADGVTLQYGIPLMFVIALLVIMVSKGVQSLIKRFRFSSDAAERNQIAYLFLAMSALAVLGFASFTPFGNKYPLAHIGSG